MKQLSPSPTLAGFADWLAASANSLTEAAAKASTAGDPARGRQIYGLAQFLRPIGKACEAFAAGQNPELDLVSPAVPVSPAGPGHASEVLARCQRELAELAAGDTELEAELLAIRGRVAAHAAVKMSVINRMTAELELIRAGMPA